MVDEGDARPGFARLDVDHDVSRVSEVVGVADPRVETLAAENVAAAFRINSGDNRVAISPQVKACAKAHADIAYRAPVVRGRATAIECRLASRAAIFVGSGVK